MSDKRTLKSEAKSRTWGILIDQSKKKKVTEIVGKKM